MTDYQGNSNKGKEEKTKEIKPLVLTSEVVVKKPSVGSKFKHIFFGGDFQTAAEYVAANVLLPALRNLLLDSISKGADRLIYGDSIPRHTPRPTGYTSYQPRVQYNNPIHRPASTGRAYLPDQPPPWQVSETRKMFKDITVGSKEDAESIVEGLMTIIQAYEIVSVSDLHELVGIPASPVDNKWGWSNLSSISINQTRDGWTITFPPVEEI